MYEGNCTKNSLTSFCKYIKTNVNTKMINFDYKKDRTVLSNEIFVSLHFLYEVLPCYGEQRHSD